MIKLALIFLAAIAVIIIPLRFAVSYGGFFQEGVFSGLQSCDDDEDCLWVPTSCCDCTEGGGEMLINGEKELIYKLLVKPFCLEKQACGGTNSCHSQEVFCDRTCKFGERTYTKPLLYQ